MWVTCHNCDGYGYSEEIVDQKKMEIPCEKCNPNGTAFIFLLGQLWVDDDYIPVSQPSSPR